MIALALVLQLLAAPVTAGGMPGATPSAPGNPHFVQIVSIVGVPSDSTMHAQFEGAFRATFAESDLPGQRLAKSGEWNSELPLPNRFRLLEGDTAEDAWTIDVSIGAPAVWIGNRKPTPQEDALLGTPARMRVVNKKLRTSRGMVVAFVVGMPAPTGGISRSESVRTAFYFPALPVEGASLSVPTGFKYPWAAAGRIAATLVLESLHRESGDLLESERMDIAPGIRIDPGANAGGSR